MNRKWGEGLSNKGGKEGWGFVLGGPPCAALERSEFQKVTLSNLFYPSLEVGREKVNMIFALIFPTKLSTFLSFPRVRNNMLCSRGDILSFQEYYPVRSLCLGSILDRR